MEHFINDIYQEISKANSSDHINAIPHSDTFSKNMEMQAGIKRHEVGKAVQILKEAHKIFFIEIVKEDESKDIKRVVGYVETVPSTITRLKVYFQNTLIMEYQNQFKVKLPVASIIRELLAKPSYKNSLIGQIANKAMMLEEYENLLKKEPGQYTDIWKNRALEEIISQIRQADRQSPAVTAQEEVPPVTLSSNQRRAVDSDLYGEYSKTTAQKPAATVLKIYGLEFFLRVNFRKYNFSLLTDMINKGTISGKEDLRMMKSMLLKVKANADRDRDLAKYAGDIHGLEKAIVMRMVSGK